MQVKSHVVVIGCGIIGASIAYELSTIPSLRVTVLDRQPPAQAATGAALGVLMGVISQKVKGRAWQLRQTSLQRYATLIPQLEAETGLQIPQNQQGVLMLCFDAAEQEKWQRLIETRQQQGWELQWWEVEQVGDRCPRIQSTGLAGAIYSPADRQIDPTALTLALVEAAQRRGVSFQFDAEVQTLVASKHGCEGVQTSSGAIAANWVVVAAGLGSTSITQIATQSVVVQPVLGQAVRLRLDRPLGQPEFQPVITGHDIHIVPLNEAEYWVGATVEFPIGQQPVVADSDRLDEVMQGAIALCPQLADAELVYQWSGLRPRPVDRPAPVIEFLSGYPNVLLATGHYRNGVLLAPATAIAVRELITSEQLRS
jgi:glycine oxidase ThiO